MNPNRIPIALFSITLSIFSALSARGSSASVAFYPAEGNGHDISGSGHNAIVPILGDPGLNYTPGKIGQAFRFDPQAGTYVDFGNWFDFQSFTLAMWVRDDSTQGSQQSNAAPIFQYLSNGDFIWSLTYNTTTHAYEWKADGAATVTFAIAPGTWHYLAITRDATTGTTNVYLDGYIVGSSAQGPWEINYDFANKIRMGADFGLTNYWHGAIDEFRIHDRVLSRSEIELLSSSYPVDLVVPGTANPYLSGMPAGSSACSGDSAPAQSPVLISGLDLQPGSIVRFNAAGSVDNTGATPIQPPDGTSMLGHSAENGLSGVNYPINALVGVFLDNTQPNGSPAPASLDFSGTGNVAGGIDYGTISPALKQIFFIGDGVTASGTLQQVVVPEGATRLYIGTSDGCGWYNNTGSFSMRVSAVEGPPPPPHGGLSATALTINDSNSPEGNLADTVLRFAAQQTGRPAGLLVRVQATTTPNNEGSWTNLPNGRNGRMSFSAQSTLFILNTLDYPRLNGIYFRAIASAPGYPDSISSPVPPADQPGLNLASNTPRLGPTSLSFTANGTLADLYFLAIVADASDGRAVRIQSTTNPDDEFSWTDLDDGNAGHMTHSTNPHYPNDFILPANNLPDAHGIYFRAIANLSGSLDSLSNITGPYNSVRDIPPVVTIQPPDGLPGSGDGHDVCHPVLVSAGTFHFGATAQSSHSIQKLKLQVDGSTVDQFSGASGSTDYLTNVIGDHVLSAFAIDDLGATLRVDRPADCSSNPYTYGPLYIRVLPDGSNGIGAPQTVGKIFTLVQNLSFWNNPNAWQDEDHNPGVPGADDVAVIDSKSVGFQGDVIVRSMTLIGNARLQNGLGAIIHMSVLGTLTIVGGSVQGPIQIIVEDGAKCQLLNSNNIQFSQGAELYNRGTINVLGAAGLVGADTITNEGKVNFGAAISIIPFADVDPAAGTRMLAGQVVINSGLVNGDASRLITNDGGGIVGNDGASIVATGGGNIVTPLITNDGGSLITNDGGSLITNDGGSLMGGGNAVSATGTGDQAHRKAMRIPTGSSGYTQTGGETDLTSFTIIGSVTLNGGTLSGSGVIGGDLTNNGGTISPGHSAGAIGVIGSFSQGANGSLIVEDGGKNPSQCDQVQVAGSANLGGNLTVNPINNYVPDAQDTFSPLAYASVTGDFSSVSSNAQVTLTPNGLLMAVNATPLPQPPTANAASDLSSYSFVTNWNSSTGATSYRLDVSTSSLFNNYVPRYQNRNVGNVTSFIVKGLSPNTTYYYRVRAYNSVGGSDNSNTITVVTFPANPRPTPTPKPRPTPSATPTPTPRPSATPK